MKRYIVILLMAFAVAAKSQPHLSVTNGSFSFDTVMPMNTVDTAEFLITNTGSSAFSGPFTLYMAAQDSTGGLFHEIDTVEVPPVVLAGGSSIPVEFIQLFDHGPTRFHYDINVIVIWPYALGATFDSLYLSIDLQLADGQDELDISKLLSLYPNPSGGDIWLRKPEISELEEVRIYDLGGRLVSTIRSDNNCLKTGDLQPGIYLIQIRLKDGRSGTLRLMKQ